MKFASYRSPPEVIWHSPLTQPLKLFYGYEAALPLKMFFCNLTTRCTCASLNFPFYNSLFRRCWQRNARRQIRLHTSGTERLVHQVWHYSKDSTNVLEFFYCRDPVKSDLWYAHLHLFNENCLRSYAVGLFSHVDQKFQMLNTWLVLQCMSFCLISAHCKLSISMPFLFFPPFGDLFCKFWSECEFASITEPSCCNLNCWPISPRDSWRVSDT